MNKVPKEYFSYIFMMDNGIKTKALENVNNNAILRIVSIAVEELLDVLKSMKVDKSPGANQVHLGIPWEAGEEANGTCLDGHLGWHWRIRPKSLFPCSMTKIVHALCHHQESVNL